MMTRENLGIFARGNKLYFCHTNAKGELVLAASGFDVGREAGAAKLLKLIRQQLAAQRESMRGRA